jgi:hypothetical protein
MATSAASAARILWVEGSVTIDSQPSFEAFTSASPGVVVNTLCLSYRYGPAFSQKHEGQVASRRIRGCPAEGVAHGSSSETMKGHGGRVW